MFIFVRSLLCVSIVASFAAAQESLKAWPRIQSGTTVYYTTTFNISQEVAIGKRKVEQVFKIHTEEIHSVGEVESDGALVVSITRTRIWGTVNGSSFKSAVSFDTATNGRIHPLAKSYVDMLLPVSIVKVDRSNKVLSVQRARQNGELRDPDDHERDTTQFSFVHAPKMPMVVGTSWRPAEGIHECGATGCFELVTRNEISKMDKDSLTIVTVAVDDHAEGVEPMHRVERTISLSRRDGLLLEMQATGTSRSDGIEGSVRIEMKRVSKQPDPEGTKRETPATRR